MEFGGKRIPPELVGLILSNLGQNDLLNCRLVSQAWNAEVIFHFRRHPCSNFATKLTINKATDFYKYCHFLEPQKVAAVSPRSFVLPFHIEVYLELSKHLSFGPAGFMTRLFANLTSLLNAYGPNCVSKLTLRSNPSIEFLGLFKLLSLVCGGLKELDLTELKISAENHIVVQNTLRANHGSISELFFPNLRVLKCNGRPFLYAFEEANPFPIYSIIIQKSLNLEVLNYKAGCMFLTQGAYGTIPFDTLKTFKAGPIWNPIAMLNQIRAAPTPVISTFSFVFFVNHPVRKVFGDILTAISSTLQYLKIKYLRLMDSSSSELPPFPKLPTLKSMKLRFEHFSFPVVLNSESINFNKFTFPKLESLDIPTGCRFVVTTKRTVPNIKNLKILVQGCAGEHLLVGAYSEVFTADIKNLRITFPRVVRVLVKEESKSRSSSQAMKAFLEKFVLFDKKITVDTLEVETNGTDIFGQTLIELFGATQAVIGSASGQNLVDSSPTPYGNGLCVKKSKTPGSKPLNRRRPILHKLSNLKTLRLKVNRNATNDPYTTRASSQLLNLDHAVALGRTFPLLAQLDISEAIFAGSRISVLKTLEIMTNMLSKTTINLLEPVNRSREEHVEVANSTQKSGEIVP